VLDKAAEILGKRAFVADYPSYRSTESRLIRGMIGTLEKGVSIAPSYYVQMIARLLAIASFLNL
jgi:hypothetical protein